MWHAHVKRLHGPLEGRFRYRVASLRVIYTVNREARRVIIEAIGSRGEIYR